VSADTVDHLIHNVIPAATDYMTAENELTAAYAKDVNPAAWESAGRHGKRRAAEDERTVEAGDEDLQPTIY